MSSSCGDRKQTPIELPINQLLQSIVKSLQHEWISECQELCQILQSPFVYSLLNAVDCVARQVYDNEIVDKFFRKYLIYNSENEKSTIISAKPLRRLPKEKFVNVIKSHEPLGVTVRIDEQTGDIIFTRVLVGGAAYRSGLVNVGDRILEVNGISLRGRSHLELINILQKECMKTMISFKILVHKQMPNENAVKSIMVRTHFDYDPVRDPLIPCDKIGLAFSKGSILNVLNREDPDWWQACKEIESANKSRMEVFQIAGLIPSSQLQEQRIVAIRDIKSRLDHYRYIYILAGLLPTPFRKNKWVVQKIRRTMYDLRDCINYDREEICTYEPVAKYLPKPHYFRPIILVGPPEVGCSILIRLLVNYKPNRYREPLLHTTRYKRVAETNGIDYYFASEEWMEKEIQRGHFVCYSQHKGNYYGLHKRTITQIIDSGYVCIFKMDGKFLRLIHTAEFKPFVIFIRPPYDVNKLIECHYRYAPFLNRQKSRSRLEYEMHLMIYEAHRIQYLYGHKFDHTIVNEDIESTFKQLYEVMVSVENEPKWVPLNWVKRTSL